MRALTLTAGPEAWLRPIRYPAILVGAPIGPYVMV